MNRFASPVKPLMWFLALLLAVFLAGCGDGDGGTGSNPDTVVPGPAGTPGASATDPTVGSASPGDGATDVPTGTNSNGNVVTGTLVAATFTQPMDPATIISPALSFTLKETSGNDVPGTVAMNAANTIATFTPAAILTPNASYTATVGTTAMNAGGTAMANTVAWSFTTGDEFTAQAPVELGSASNFAILTKAGITNVSPSAVSGNIGVSPIGYAAITGFVLVPAVPDGANTSSTSAQVTGLVFAADYADPTPANLDTAVLDAEAAYADAAGRAADVIDVPMGGDVSGFTLAPGVYKWNTGVSINTGDVILAGSATDVWIFQVSGGITQANGTQVLLEGGALPKNVFWQTADVAAIGTDAHFEGIILSSSSITVGARSAIFGRLYSGTNVTLIQNTVTQPAP